MENHEDPDQWLQQRKLETPVLLMAETNTLYLVVGKKIFCTFKNNEIPESVIGLPSSYYALDFDYPQSLKLCLSVLQFFCFEYKATPSDL
ncbi:Hypothetical predicted protein [Paramuricea clavata]|uniref:Uncharacterized protein n=1 Tax=Paramuricea clavata TaxID=317549 RepID=A0A7D9JZD7_PARCT|nr:Hypothetical predicted protein [Paramuricea clavata]